MELRVGYTTGACATAATKAAAIYMLEGYLPEEVSIQLPNRDVVTFSICHGEVLGDQYIATVIKDAGDDPDVTNGMEISSCICRSHHRGVIFRAGDGVGVITKPGLQLEVGEAAINPVPRNMICNELFKLGLRDVEVEISAKDGVLIAAKTFNPRLGIEGGISIIGTTGVVRPYNRDAVQKTIELNINVVEASKTKTVVLVPGNLGSKAAIKLGIGPNDIVEVGNEWETAINKCRNCHFDCLSIVGHPGKIAKFINREFYTRSRDSAPATEVVTKVSKDMGICVTQSNTVEGIFMELNPKERKALGDKVAKLSLNAAKDYFKLEQSMKVILTSMQGEVLGEAHV